MTDYILKVDRLSKRYVIRNGLFDKVRTIKAVDDISFDIAKGESVGLIGESGCGKSTTANLLLKLIEPSTGRIELLGEDITGLDEATMRPYRKDIQMIFQHSHAVLDPKMTVRELVREPLKIHKTVIASMIMEEVDRLLTMVGLSKLDGGKFPEQLSGGQNQRVIIARAIAVRPKLIVCDEPVSALDISVQGQILNLLITLKDQMGLSYLFITHDLKVIRKMCDRVMVMYKGNIVESAKTERLFNNPKESYTKQLIEAIL